MALSFPDNSSRLASAIQISKCSWGASLVLVLLFLLGLISDEIF